MQIPVALIAPDGGETDDPVAGCPCIRVIISASDDGSSPAFDVWALLDTGADKIFVEVGLNEAIGAPIKGTGPVYSATQVINQPIHEAFIFVKDGPSLKTEYTAVPLPHHRSRYHIVLGRAFLRAFDFRFDQETQAFSLRYQNKVSGSH